MEVKKEHHFLGSQRSDTTWRAKGSTTSWGAKESILLLESSGGLSQSYIANGTKTNSYKIQAIQNEKSKHLANLPGALLALSEFFMVTRSWPKLLRRFRFKYRPLAMNFLTMNFSFSSRFTGSSSGLPSSPLTGTWFNCCFRLFSTTLACPVKGSPRMDALGSNFCVWKLHKMH